MLSRDRARHPVALSGAPVGRLPAPLRRTARGTDAARRARALRDDRALRAVLPRRRHHHAARRPADEPRSRVVDRRHCLSVLEATPTAVIWPVAAFCGGRLRRKCKAARRMLR